MTVAARNALIEEHLDIARVIARRLARRCSHDAEDLEGIALCATVEMADAYEPDRASFKTYLWKMLPLRVIDELRRQSGRDGRASVVSLETPATGGLEGVLADERQDVERSAHALLALEGLHQLPNKLAVVLALRAIGFTFDEIAELFQVSAGRVHNMASAGAALLESTIGAAA